MLLEILERGFPAIPVFGKKSCVGGWSRWCHELPPKYLVEQWAKRFPFPKFGIAICLGPASNLDALDIDSESSDILDRCPRSPVSRRGARGRMDLFLHNPKLVKIKCFRNSLTIDDTGKDKEGVEVLSTGNYIVIPPSVHPDTGRRYEWIGPYSLDNFSPLDLEQLENKHLESALIHISRFQLTNASGQPMDPSIGGRNNKLAVMCYAKILTHPEKSDEIIANELLEFDNRAHSPPYFSDKNEMYFRKAKTPLARALLFVSGSRARIQKKGL